MPEDAPGSPESCVAVVDLRALDQDELLHLSASQLEVSLEVVDISIDRSIFNESKEPTFSPAPPDRRHRATSSSAPAAAIANGGSGGKAIDLAEEVELIRHLDQLDGFWVSQRKKEKIIAAKGFPQGWTVKVGLCIRDGRCFLNYHNYTSPEGKSWPSFKAAAEYLVAKLCPDSQNPPELEKTPPEMPVDQGSGSETPETPEDGPQKQLSLSARNVKSTERGFECLACGKCFRRKSQCVGHQMIHSTGKRKRGEIAPAETSSSSSEIQTSNNNGGGELEGEASRAMAEKNVDSSPECESCQVCKKLVVDNPVYCSWCEREYHPDCVRAPIERDWTCVICNFVA